MSGIVNSTGARSGVIGQTEIDYEEGFYTYTLPVGGGSITPRSGYTLLKYIKIGRVCNVFGHIETDGESSPSGHLSLSLPFTAGANENSSDNFCASGLPAHFRAMGDSFEDSYLDILTGAVVGLFYSMDHDGSKNNIQETNVDTAFHIDLNISYHTV